MCLICVLYVRLNMIIIIAHCLVSATDVSKVCAVLSPCKRLYVVLDISNVGPK